MDQEQINWNAVAEELMERLRHRKDNQDRSYTSQTFWLDSMMERERLAECLRDMFGRFLEESNSYVQYGSKRFA